MAVSNVSEQVAVIAPASGGKAIGFATDVTKCVEAEALIQGVVETLDRADVVANNRHIISIARICSRR